MTTSLERWRHVLGDDAVRLCDATERQRAPGLGAETPVVSPNSVEQVAAALRFAARERLRVLPAGALEHIHLSPIVQAGVDAVLSSRRLDRVLEFEPDDLTMVAEAGVTLHDVNRQAQEHQQRLAPDLWPGEAATLGGACAANRSGLTRLRYGTLRDAVLGARLVHADGSVTRTGGKVVKNVTGYDLAKLYIGSHGSLVFIAEVNVRLLARPHATALVHATHTLAEARERVWAIHRSRLQPASIVISGSFDDETVVARARHAGDTAEANTAEANTAEASVHVSVRFEGRAAVVEGQANDCKRRLDGRVVPAARAPWDALRCFPEPRTSHAMLQISSVPTSVFDVASAARTILGGGVAFVGLFGVGTTWLRAPTLNAETAQALRDALPSGWHARLTTPLGTRALDPPQAGALQHAMKKTFDAHDILPRAPFTHDEARV